MAFSGRIEIQQPFKNINASSQKLKSLRTLDPQLSTFMILSMFLKEVVLSQPADLLMSFR